MNPDTATLLDDLTAARHHGGEALVHALRINRRRKAQRRALAVSALSIAAVVAGIRFPPRESPEQSVAVEPARSTMLTESELLDSFGDQPVALVTWPDGRQQLLAITRAPVRIAAR